MHKRDAKHSCDSVLLGLDIWVLLVREHYTTTASFVLDNAFLFQSFLDLSFIINIKCHLEEFWYFSLLKRN